MDAARKAIEQLLGGNVKGTITLEFPEKPGFGDLAFPCFTLAKEQKGNPMNIAQELAAKLKPNAWVQKIEAKGPYVNFFLNPAALGSSVLAEVQKRAVRYGSRPTADPKRIVIEYSCPNTNKPLHLGHLRNIFLGKSVANLLTAQGHTVIHVNLNNDRGIHISKSMLAYQKWGKNADPDKKSDHFVGDWYVRFAQEAKANPALEEEAQQMLQDWEAGDKTVRALWAKMNQWALNGFAETYRKLGVQFDKVYNESAFYDKAKPLVEDGIKRKVFERTDDGSVMALLEPQLPNKVVLRADGTSIYITQDMFLAKLKSQDFNFDISINVVGSEQNLHFQQLYKILELLGFPWAKDCYHLSYGMVNLPSGRMKSREGTVVDADDIMAEVEQLCATEIQKRHERLDAKTLEKRAEQIGFGALRFFILKHDPAKDMVYNPEESIALEGETGPYVQYAAARIASVLRKHGEALPEQFDASLLTAPEERTLLKQIAQFPETVAAAARQYKPSLLAHFLLELAQSFSAFYHLHPVLQAEPKLRDARLHLCNAVRQVLVNGLGLLDIQVPEEM